MAVGYKCTMCPDKIYEKQTQDGYCPIHFEEELVEVVIPDRPTAALIPPPPPPQPIPEPTAGAAALKPAEGLGILVCDASGSMDEDVFPVERPGLAKLQLVVGAVQRAILQMHNLTENDKAYVAIIAFGKRATLIKDSNDKPFVRSVKDILDEFGRKSARQKVAEQGGDWDRLNDSEKEEKLAQVFTLGDHLFKQFHNAHTAIDRSRTNITEALNLAWEITNAALSGSLTAWGGPKAAIKRDPVGVLRQSDTIEIPNVRVMIYSDGQHNVDTLKNPFSAMTPASVLMSAFIGDENADDNTRTGADQMRDVANTCPTHGKKGYFLINTLGRRVYLREVFHMATGHSGFCRECGKGEGVVAIP